MRLSRTGFDLKIESAPRWYFSYSVLTEVRALWVVKYCSYRSSIAAFLKVGESLALLNPSAWFEKAIKELNNCSSSNGSEEQEELADADASIETLSKCRLEISNWSLLTVSLETNRKTRIHYW